MSIAVATAPFDLPIRQSIDAVTGSGADGVQFDLRAEVNTRELGPTGRRQLMHYLEERNLKVGPCTFALRRPLADPHALDAKLDAIKQAMSFAWEIGSRCLTLQLGDLPDADAQADNDILKQVLIDLANHANRVGVVPTLMTTAAPHRLAGLLNAITSGPLSVEADPAGLILRRISPVDWMREMHPHVRHVQLRDAMRDTGGLGKEVALGRGEVDWDEVAAMLNEMEYRDWVTVIRSAGHESLPDTLRGVQFARRLLRN